MPRSAEENAGWTTLIRVDVRARAGTARDGLPKKKKKKTGRSLLICSSCHPDDPIGRKTEPNRTVSRG